jgi:hypothetical protein
MRLRLAITALLAALAVALLLLRGRDAADEAVLAPQQVPKQAHQEPSAPLVVEDVGREQPITAPLTQPSARTRPSQRPPQALSADPTAAAGGAAAELSAAASEAEAPHIALDQLLRLPAAAPTPVGPQSLDRATSKPTASTEEPKKPGRLQMNVSSEEPLAAAPRPRDWRRSEAGVTVRVDEADRLRLRGGVRVDERAEAETKREVEASPSVGVEVRF